MTTITLDRLAKFAADQVAFGENNLDKFKARMEQNPAYAFEWSSDAFKAAACFEVGRTLQTWLQNIENGGGKGTPQEKADGIMEEVSRMVCRAARWPERSTSVQSNVMKQEIAAVWAELLAKQQGW